MPNINQFGLDTVQGAMDMQVPGTVITGAVGPAVATPLIAGQPVKMIDSAGGIPKFTPLTANTDAANGFVCYNPILGSFAAGRPFELAMKGSIMWMTAGAAIARNAEVEVVYTTNKVITAAGTNPVVGRALDKAAADGDLIRVYIETPLVTPTA